MGPRFVAAAAFFVLAAIVLVEGRPESPSWQWMHGRVDEITIGGSSGWKVGDGRYEDIGGLNVGDSVIFNWVGAHTVTLMLRKNCRFAGSTELAAGSAAGEPSSFKFTFTEPGSYVFADSVGDNCQKGMLFSCWVRTKKE